MQKNETMISKQDPKARSKQLCGLWADSAEHKITNADQREMWTVLLAARAGAISGRETPEVWTNRTLLSTGARLIVGNLFGQNFGLEPTRAVILVREAIKDSGQLGKFNNWFPATGAAFARLAA